MRTIDHITMYAEPDEVYLIAARIEDWPKFMPHYRRIKELSGDEDGRILEINAKRGLVPIKWTAVQTFDPENKRIYYRHTGGLTRGIGVEWSILPQGDKVRVLVTHDMTLKAPIFRSGFGRMLVDLFVIKYMASCTLARMKEHIEARGIRDMTGNRNRDMTGNSEPGR